MAYAAPLWMIWLAFGLPAGNEDDSLSFERDVRPIFKAYCLDCHGGEDVKGGLDLRLARFAAKGGESGPGIVPGSPDESYVLARMQDGEMPPGDVKVPAAQIEMVERWIQEGAKTSRDEPESLPPGIDITPEDRAFWAFQPLTRPELPAEGSDPRVRTPIDAFVLQKLRANGLDFAPEADRRTLIRRVSADLTGLPPTPEEVDAFVNDASADAYEKMVDRLLESPRYGERWARHWLDVAGYADSEGNGNDDTIRAHQWRYRDYVIRAFNEDKPLDRFVVEQLAADELVPRPWNNLTPEQVNLLAATGFFRNGPDGTATGGGDEALLANQTVADGLKIVGSTLLGLTVGCAQCHDHRYDPIPQEDYFRLRAVFEPAMNPKQWRRPGQRLVSLYTDEDRAKAAAIEAEAQAMQKELDAKTAEAVARAIENEVKKLPDGVRERVQEALAKPGPERTEEQKQLLASHPSVNLSAGVLYQYDQAAADVLKKEAEKIAAKRAEKPVEEFVGVLDETPGVVPETFVFHRGDHRQPTRAVTPGDLTIAAPDGSRFEIPASVEGAQTSGRRLAYAKHLTSGSHPMVGRVLANRIWLHHFGAGLVSTPGDFGALGTKPSHPELLDWLATELPNQGWSLKRMHKLIVGSTVYRQSSARRPEQEAMDSSNALLARYPVRRLDAEALRDRILAVSGRLSDEAFGPPVPVSEDAVGQSIPAGDSTRRGIYLQARRTKPVSFLSAFDAPSQGVNCERRVESTSPSQSLMLMNSDFVLKSAEAMADRVLGLPAAEGSDEGANVVDRRLEYAWRLAYQRSISEEERKAAAAFLEAQSKVAPVEPPMREKAAWTDLCQQLLSSNEFLYVD